MTDASFRQSAQPRTIDATTPTFEISAGMRDGIIAAVGALLFALGGILFANYMMLPFGN